MPRQHARRPAIGRKRRKLLVSLSVLVVGPAVVFLLIRPSVITAAILHGMVLAILLVVAFAPIGMIRGVGQRACAGAALTGGLYFVATSLPLISVDVIPWLPSEHLLAAYAEGISPDWIAPGPRASEPMEKKPKRSVHWSAAEPGDWANYVRRSPFERRLTSKLNPRQIAFHRIGHDVVALALCLVGAFLASLYREPDPNDRPRQPAPESVEIVRRLMTQKD